MSFSYQISQFVIPLNKKDHITSYVLKYFKILTSDLVSFKILRLSLDSRKKENIYWSLNAEIVLKSSMNHRDFKAIPKKIETKKTRLLDEVLAMPKKVTIVGAGPAGLWAALSLLRKGFEVELHEQGQNVKERLRDIRHFIKRGEFSARSNILFGEGGAGAFSDGKLTSRATNIYTKQVLEDIAKAGAGNEVMYLAKPHIGTDRLQFIVKELREWIICYGGKIFFDSKLDDIEIKDGAISQASFNGKWQTCEALVLAIGHSARDVYELLHERGVALESKSFAMGVRIEHRQDFINARQFGGKADVKLTGSAEYALNVPDRNSQKGAYTFCMCPGGVVLPCASEEGLLTTNGMSYSRRNSPYANSAIVVSVDYTDQDLMFGMEQQRKLERDAFIMGGENYGAPAQTIEAFLDRGLDNRLFDTSFQRELVASDLNGLLPQEVRDPLRKAMLDFDKKIPGFIRSGLMIAPETRTSSPLRIVRNRDNFESINVKNLFPIGEGAGYAGGIVSSAADGVKLAAISKIES